MAEDQAEVRIKLVVDDHTAAATDHFKEGLKEAQKEADHAKGHAEDMSGAVFKGTMHAHLLHKAIEIVKEGIQQAYEIAEKFAEAALEAATDISKQERAMAGLLGMMDRGQHSIEQIRYYAGEVREELELAGLKAGESGKSMSEAFDLVIERGGVSSEKAKELTEQMATVGKITRGGMQGLAEGFSALEMGPPRVRNAIVQLISSTHTLQGNAKQVAEQLNKMTPEKRIELGAEAIKKQADLMGKGGGPKLNLEELKTSFGGVREVFSAAMGKPMLDALLPPLTRVKDFLLEHIDTIQQWGTIIGRVFGQAIEVLSKIFGGIYDAIHENWDDIVSVAESATSQVRDAFRWIYDNREAIGHTFKDIAADMIHAFTWIRDAINTVYDKMVAVLKMIPGVGTAIASHQAGTAEGEMHAKAQVTGKGADLAFEESIAKFRALSLEAGKNAGEIEHMTQAIRQQHYDATEAAKAFDFDANMGQKSKVVAEYINKSIAMHREGAIQHAISILEGSATARQALVASSGMIAGGLDSFISMLDEKSPKLAKMLKDLSGGKMDIPKGVGGGTVNMNGGQTFNIKQDFRDQDPDRIALIFRKDILKAAAARTQSRVTSPFGM